jgi:hypothetical protein
MNKGSLFLAVCLIVFACAIPASAGGIEQGTVELSTSTFFSFNSYSDDDEDLSITNVNIAGGIGYFATNIFEVITGLAIVHQSIDPGDGESFSTTDLGLGMSLRFNFGTESKMVPYVGIGAGIVGHSGDTPNEEVTIVAPSIEAGFRVVVGSRASVNIGAAYEHQINALGVEDVSGNVILVGVGISAFVIGGADD